MGFVLVQNTFPPVPLSSQEYKWIAEISQGSLIKCQGGREGGGGNRGMDWHPSREGLVGSYS